jgi:serine/threonine protein kinase
VITTVPRERPDLSVPRCDQCHRDVRDERPDGASGVYTCQACSGDSAAIRLADLVDRAIARGERYPPEIPGYRRVRRLGVGGAGVAYQAVRIADGRPAALKLLLPGKNSDERARQMFERELQSLWLLRHRNLVEFLQRGLVGQVPWVAMEYCSGGNLEALMKARGGLLKVPEAVAVMLDVLKGLSFMHGRGFVHRDLKPENILLTEDPYRVPIAKVADLGLAHSFEKAGLSGVTVTGLVFGTLRFMPPEQVTRYRWVDPRTDQWAAAATLYYLLTGALTRDFSDTQDPLLTVVFGAIVPLRSRDPSLPVELAAVVDHALDREPAKRFATVAEFAEALRRAVPGS